MNSTEEFRADAIGRGQVALDKWNHGADDMTERQLIVWAYHASEALTRLLAVARTGEGSNR